MKAHPAQLAAAGYLSNILLGFLLLCLPWAQQVPVGLLDNLFTATSAVSTTGLVTVSTSDSYTFFGQLVVLALIQIGGLGYMTFGSLVILASGGNLSSRREILGRTVFSLPSDFRLDRFLISVVVSTLLVELVGAAVLYPILAAAGRPDPAWSAVFHSVSSFCTAGFGLYNNSFEDFKGNVPLNAVVAILSYLGAIGFIVCLDVWRKLRGEVRSITLTSKLILVVTASLTLIGTLLIFAGEPAIQHEAAGSRLLQAFFQCMTALTTVGFNTIPIGAMSKASLLVIIMLMVIGASPSGTGGGLKSTTFAALFGVLRGALRGESQARFWDRRIPLERVWMAVASLWFYLTALAVGVYLLSLSEVFEFERLFFEAASALGTVGLSTGITGSLSVAGKAIIVALMFLGRISPLTFGIALFSSKPGHLGSVEEDLAV